MTDLDLDAIRKESEDGQSPEWIAKYGDASWEAALAVMGITPTHSEPSE